MPRFVELWRFCYFNYWMGLWEQNQAKKCLFTFKRLRRLNSAVESMYDNGGFYFLWSWFSVISCLLLSGCIGPIYKTISAYCYHVVNVISTFTLCFCFLHLIISFISTWHHNITIWIISSLSPLAERGEMRVFQKYQSGSGLESNPGPLAPESRVLPCAPLKSTFFI